MSTKTDERLRQTLRHAYDNAPALRARFDAAGLAPDDIQTTADLDKLPILPKDEVTAIQQAAPPFGGMLAVPMSEINHIYLSPGPLYEPDTSEDEGWVETAHAGLRQCGFTPDDIVINTLSYHLVPAGLMLDRALVSLGCTVVPGGVGNSDLQVKMMKDIGVSGYVGTPSFLMALIRKAEEMGFDFRADFALEKAFVTAEPLPPSLFEALTGTYGLSVGNAYATAELGLLALNTDGQRPMNLLEAPIVQIVDSDTGKSVGPGEAGEVVVTNFDRAYPLIRFGSGDMAINLDPKPGESRQAERQIILVGRSGEAVKVRGMFVHPNQLRAAVGQLLSGAAVQGVITRPDVRDHFLVRIAAEAADDAIIEQLHAVIRQICRVRADAIEFVEALPENAPGMADERSWE